MTAADVPPHFVELIARITSDIADRPLDAGLGDRLNRQFPPGGETFDAIERMCRDGVDQGWLCAREHGGIKFGRPVKPGEVTHGFSVDVVEMDNIAGPHHVHPHGEIDMVMPLEGDANFDGSPRGWKVYEPGSAHRPTVSGGKALILYLLPDGAIEFSRG